MHKWLATIKDCFFTRPQKEPHPSGEKGC
jgi:hypothetical protein